jgi:hypothetical protein
MKIDRFMRVMLVIIALLLGAICLKDWRNPLTDNAVEAAPPVFLQVGKKYTCLAPTSSGSVIPLVVGFITEQYKNSTEMAGLRYATVLGITVTS